MKKIWLLVACCQFAFAYDDRSVSECDYIAVKLVNLTTDDCEIVAQKMPFGKIVNSSVPAILPRNTVNSFILQDLNGTELELEYSCKSEVLSFQINRNPVLFSAQDVSLNLLSSNTLDVSIVTEPGSCWWGSRAAIEIVFKSASTFAE